MLLFVHHRCELLSHVLQEFVVLLYVSNSISREQMGLPSSISSPRLPRELQTSYFVVFVPTAACCFPHFGPAVALRNRLLALVMKAHEGSHHVFGLPYRAKLVVVTAAVLL